MQRNAIESHSIVTDRNDNSISGFAIPNLTLGESLISFSCAQIPNSDQLWNNTSNATSSSYPQIQNIPSDNYPFECPRNVINSFESMNYSHYEGVPFDASINKWDFNKFTTPQEFIAQETENPVLNEWLTTDQRALIPFSNELSLSLSTSRTSIQDQCSDMSSSSLTSFSLQKRPSEITSCSSNNNHNNNDNNNNNNLSLSCNSYKPVQIPSLALGSKFFHAMQEILAEIARYALENFDQMGFSKHYFPSISNGLDSENVQERDAVEAKMKHITSLLQQVDEQYNQCVDEIHTVISAFHAVTELDPNLHARFALPTISLMYKSLRERISSHILEMGARFNSKEREDQESSSFDMSLVQKQWALQQLKKRDHQLWRPQRGLPERSVSVLRAWMFQNFLHPYPKEAEKQLLAMKSGLTRSQVSNWFINARVRLWKPMIEEMCADMNRRKASRNDEGLSDGAQRNYIRFENRR